MLIYSSLRGFIASNKDMNRENLFRCSELLNLITTNHYHKSSDCFADLENMDVFLGNGCFQIGVVWGLGEQVLAAPDSESMGLVLDMARQLIHAPIWYSYTCNGRLYFLLCYPRLHVEGPEDSNSISITKQNVADFETLQSQLQDQVHKTDKNLRFLISDLCRDESEIYLMTNSLDHAIEYTEFRSRDFQKVYVSMEEQLHKAFVEDLSTYRILATHITNAIRLPDCDTAALAKEIADHIISNSSSSMESIHHHVQIFILSFTDYLGSSGTVNSSFLAHHRVTTKIMHFEREEELIQRLHEILNEICQQYHRLKTTSRQHQILQIRDYVDEHLTDAAMTVASVSEQFHIAPSHLTAQFQRYFGITLYKYIQRGRVNLCLQLMQKDPSLSLEDLAEKAGYTDLSTMYRAFKKYEGTTPGAFRLTCRQGK
jgi:AraC-like DNA-binding protein